MTEDWSSLAYRDQPQRCGTNGDPKPSGAPHQHTSGSCPDILENVEFSIVVERCAAHQCFPTLPTPRLRRSSSIRRRSHSTILVPAKRLQTAARQLRTGHASFLERAYECGQQSTIIGLSNVLVRSLRDDVASTCLSLGALELCSPDCAKEFPVCGSGRGLLRPYCR